MSKTVSPPTRVSVPVSAEVREVFQVLADAGNMSLGRAMAAWLEDTMDGAAFTAAKMQEARSAPRAVMQEMHAYALGLADETGSLLERVRAKGRARATRATGLQPGAGGGGAEDPPPCNTGGKLPVSKGQTKPGAAS